MPKDWEKRLEQLGPPGGAKSRGRAPAGESLMVDRPHKGGEGRAAVPASSAAALAGTGRALKPLILLAAVQAFLLVVIAVFVARYAGVL